MALTFGANLTDRLDCGPGASITGLDPYTLMLWVFPTTLNITRRLVAKGTGGANTRRIDFFLALADSTQLSFAADRATTDLSYITNTGCVVTNTWCFFAVSFDSGASAGELANIYSGRLNAVAAEQTYGTATDGSGAFQSDSGVPLVIGNNSGAGVPIQGRIAVVGLVAAKLTLNQIIDWQFRPRVIANTKGFWVLGYNGTSTQPDWSGNANAGTVTGATVGNHVPLQNTFGVMDGTVPLGATLKSTTSTLGIQLALAPSGSTTALGTSTPGIQLALAPAGSTTAFGSSTPGIQLALAPAGSTTAFGTSTPGIQLALAPSGTTVASQTATPGIQLALAAAGFTELSTTATLGIQLAMTASGSQPAPPTTNVENLYLNGTIRGRLRVYSQAQL